MYKLKPPRFPRGGFLETCYAFGVPLPPSVGAGVGAGSAGGVCGAPAPVFGFASSIVKNILIAKVDL